MGRKGDASLMRGDFSVSDGVKITRGAVQRIMHAALGADLATQQWICGDIFCDAQQRIDRVGVPGAIASEDRSGCWWAHTGGDCTVVMDQLVATVSRDGHSCGIQLLLNLGTKGRLDLTAWCMDPHAADRLIAIPVVLIEDGEADRHPRLL